MIELILSIVEETLKYLKDRDIDKACKLIENSTQKLKSMSFNGKIEKINQINKTKASLIISKNRVMNEINKFDASLRAQCKNELEPIIFKFFDKVILELDDQKKNISR